MKTLLFRSIALAGLLWLPLQTQVQAGIFNHREERELDSAIAGLGELATEARLRPGDRQAMSEDRDLMREYRRHYDHWPGEQR